MNQKHLLGQNKVKGLGATALNHPLRAISASGSLKTKSPTRTWIILWLSASTHFHQHGKLLCISTEEADVAMTAQQKAQNKQKRLEFSKVSANPGSKRLILTVGIAAASPRHPPKPQ